jgi:hypothetical protein
MPEGGMEIVFYIDSVGYRPDHVGGYRINQQAIYFVEGCITPFFVSAKKYWEPVWDASGVVAVLLPLGSP